MGIFLSKQISVYPWRVSGLFVAFVLGTYFNFIIFRTFISADDIVHEKRV